MAIIVVKVLVSVFREASVYCIHNVTLRTKRDQVIRVFLCNFTAIQ